MFDDVMEKIKGAGLSVVAFMIFITGIVFLLLDINNIGEILLIVSFSILFILLIINKNE